MRLTGGGTGSPAGQHSGGARDIWRRRQPAEKSADESEAGKARRSVPTPCQAHQCSAIICSTVQSLTLTGPGTLSLVAHRLGEGADRNLVVAGAGAEAVATPQEQPASGAAADRLAVVAVPDQAELDGAAGGVSAAPAADVADDVADEELSELEDDEASLYLHTPEEAKLKELIWTELNRDFLDCQSAKAAALESAAAKVTRPYRHACRPSGYVLSRLNPSLSCVALSRDPQIGKAWCMKSWQECGRDICRQRRLARWPVRTRSRQVSRQTASRLASAPGAAPSAAKPRCSSL